MRHFYLDESAIVIKLQSHSLQSHVVSLNSAIGKCSLKPASVTDDTKVIEIYVSNASATI